MEPAMEFTSENPRADGRYCVIVASDLLPEYAKPLVLMWCNNQWNYPMSDIFYRGHVYASLGPLPTGKLAELFGPHDTSTGEVREYVQKYVDGIASALDAINGGDPGKLPLEYDL